MEKVSCLIIEDEKPAQEILRTFVGKTDWLSLEGVFNDAVEALDAFMIWFGRFAGDAALLFGARGGVYLGGGIAPKIASVLSGGAFRAAFEQKGRMVSYLAPIPVYVILAGFATLKGAAVALKTTLAPDAAGPAKSLDLA